MPDRPGALPRGHPRDPGRGVNLGGRDGERRAAHPPVDSRGEARAARASVSPERSSRMLVLVTGGGGFVGHHVVRRLLAEGDRVRCLLRRPGVPEGLRGLPVEVVVGDVTRPDSLPAALLGVEEVVHLAARLTAASEREMFETNARGTYHLVAAACSTPTVRRFVHCSSLAVCGPSDGGAGVAEDGPYRPVTWYGASKALSERIVLASAGKGLPAVVVRPPIVYGPRDRGLLSVFQALSKGFRPLLGAQPKVYSWVFGPDLADALLHVGRHPEALGRVWFAAHPEPATLERFLDLALAALGRSARTLRLPVSFVRLLAGASDLLVQLTGQPGMLTRDKVHELAPRAWVCATDRVTRTLGWRAATSLGEGVPETVRWYREHGWI